jgi:hypothetical protein
MAFKRIAIVGASAFADQALVNRAARASRPCGIDPSRKSRSCPSSGQKRKTGPLCSSHLHKGPALSYLAANRAAAKDISDPLERFRPEALYDYFFFFEVFFATFLVAAFAVFFAFFAFLAMSSSLKNWLSEHAHAVYRHAQH